MTAHILLMLSADSLFRLTKCLKMWLFDRINENNLVFSFETIIEHLNE